MDVESFLYQIKVQGSLEAGWSAWLSDMVISTEQTAEGRPLTVLTGPVADQAALRGLLGRIWDLNLVLISVEHLDDSTEKR